MTTFGRSVFLLLAIFSIATIDVRAQVCQGSLGDPLVNITFGHGTNPGPPLTTALIGYQYFPNDCPNDGFYTVRSNTSNCFSSSWHNLASDHTGDPNGYFMLVNASFQPGVFYLDTVKNLCTGTTYEFAAWIANVLKSSACNSSGIQPNLTFSIEGTDGTILQTYNTGNIPNLGAPSWQQFGFFFATPVGISDIVLRIVNNSPGGCGNDLALDDITFRPCGPQITTEIVGNPATEITICEGTNHSFTLGGSLSMGFVNPELRWQKSVDGGPWTDITGSPNNPLYVQNFPPTTPPGIYGYRLSASEADNIGSLKCRVSSQSITITVSPKPVTTISSNSPLCEKNTLTLSASGGTGYQWTGPNGFTASTDMVSITNALASQSGKYYVLITKDDCIPHLDSVIATVNPNPVATVPFTVARICEGESVTLESSGGGSYLWIPAAGLSSAIIADPVARPTDTTLYKVIVTNQFDCHDTAAITVNTVEKPRADAGPDKYIIKGGSTQLLGIATGQGIDYSWSPASYIDNVSLMQPTVNPPQDMSYLLTVVSNEGCGTSTDVVQVYVYPDVYVPNAFSPNNDGTNDTWFVPALRAYTDYTVSVFNRFGQLMFYSKNTIKPWDGTYHGMPQPTGAYVYMIDIKEEKRILKGSLILLR
ncbi:MAG: gliding motility-associated C-terminal domain-containing protein [Chitinophagaceae bacterium]